MDLHQLGQHHARSWTGKPLAPPRAEVLMWMAGLIFFTVLTTVLISFAVTKRT